VILLRPASAQDAEPLARLGRESFCAAFAHLYRPEDLDAFLEQTYGVEVVAGEIADPAITHRLAQDGERGPLTGFAKLAQPGGYAGHSDAANPLALNQLYCHPARLGEGIGAALMEWALAEARARGCDAIQLSVWAENFGAQRFYQRYGFGKIADIGFWVGAQRDDELLYELRLRDGVSG
jgi:ribosomal protein S18 acetylase RimI-like enzyme